MSTTGPEDGEARRAAYRWLAAVGCAVAFFAVGYSTLAAGHPNGDAYILFRYVENAAAGHGIVYNPGGEPAEGATDFLWFVLLTATVWLGVDVGIAALLWNAVGAGLAGWLLFDLCWADARQPLWVRAGLGTALAVVVFSGGALAAYFGFSTMLYAALVLLLFERAFRARGRALCALPVLGVVVSLFRPDGALIGVGFTAVGLLLAWRGPERRAYLAWSAGAGLVGVAYFLWRWSYFGLLLPLPLYVKQHSTVPEDATGLLRWLPGLADHARWLADPQGPLLIGLALAALVVYGRLWRDEGMRRGVACLLPLGALLGALAFAVQSQNIQWRFQAPVQLPLVLLLLWAAGRVLAARPGLRTQLIVAIGAAVVMVPTALAGVRDVRYQFAGRWNTYLETFAPRLGPALPPDTSVVLTEAGILPYWSPASFFDVVGLNTPATARRPASVADIGALDPDLVFFHHAGMLDQDVLTDGATSPGPIVRIPPDRLWAALGERERRLVTDGVEGYGETGLRTTGWASVVLTGFLHESTDYDVLLVDFKGDGRYSHVYGLKRDWALRDRATGMLEWAMQPESYRAYLGVGR